MSGVETTSIYMNDEIYEQLKRELSDYFKQNYGMLTAENVISLNKFAQIDVKKNDAVAFKKEIEFVFAITISLKSASNAGEKSSKTEYFLAKCLWDESKYFSDIKVISVTPFKVTECPQFKPKSENEKIYVSDKYNSKNSGKNRIDSIKITYNVPPKSPVKDFMVRCNRILKLIRDKCLYSIDVIKLYKQILFGKEDHKTTISEFQYIDKKYVKPYAYKKGSINENQTYAVSENNVLFILTADKYLQKILSEGKVKYVESYICINDSKYITTDDTGKDTLTKYARLHMHECCLVFDYRRKKPKNILCEVRDKWDSAWDVPKITNINSAPEIIDKTRFSKETNEDVIDAINNMKSQIGQDELNLYKNLPPNFGEALKILREWRGYTQADLAAKALTSDRTIRDLEKSKRKPSLKIVMALIIALELPPMLGLQLLHLAGYNIQTPTTENIAYNYIIFYCIGQSIHTCNEILINRFSIKRLTGKE